LREELRRWEQVQFARKHEALSQEIETAERRLADVRAREAAAAAHLAELEMMLETLRLELTSAESSATATREQAHARELEIGRREQQVRFEKQQIEELAQQAVSLSAEMRDLEARREPAQLEIDQQRESAARARHALEAAGLQVSAHAREYADALSAAQVVEREADQTRAAALGADTTLSALRQARDHAATVRDRVAAERERLDMEARDLETESGRVRQARAGARHALEQAREELQQAADARVENEAALVRARHDREALALELATRQRELAAKEARLRSLEELEAGRATFGDAARFLLAEPHGGLRPQGAIADHMDVERSYERAVDALLGDRLQHVVVNRADEVTAALALLSERGAGRCGFLVLEDAAGGSAARPFQVPAGARALRDVAHVKGPHAGAVSRLLGDALIAHSFEAARALARHVDVPVAAMTGEVFHGAWLVEGGSRRDWHGILETRGETQTLREEVAAADEYTHRLAKDAMVLDATIATSERSLTTLVDRQHAREKAIITLEAQAAHAADDDARVSRRLDVVTTDRRRAEDEERSAELRREESASAITTHEAGQRAAEASLGGVLARLQAARGEAERTMRLETQARTEQATLAERVSALDATVIRLDEAAADLETRIQARRADVLRTEVRREELRASIREAEELLGDDIRAVEGLKHEMRGLDERVATWRSHFSAREHEIRGARQALDAVRAQVTHSEVAKIRASSDLAHLAASCLEAVNASIDDVVAEVARMEREGDLAAPGRRLAAVSASDEEEDEGGVPSDAATAEAQAATPAPQAPVTPEEVIAHLRDKIDRLGPVNMMAIEQFDELEARHTFLTTQRKDLLDSIAQTRDAIRKIDKTTRERFEQAFVAINEHFQLTFTTLFGGGRAGLVLIDQESDPESGVDMIAQPPGKRLQNVQLLSGGEKALTAMALMFAIFKFRPSPFCLLDEIDAPLDDANIGRFVEMLSGMQGHTQFILITHNRKTMEIANRLYGVTMEEPGVSKLISVQLN
jgi:chromosome segregation protein